MKKVITILAGATLTAAPAFAQSAIDAYRFSQPDLKGTARFMGMGGAFSALGADLTTLSYNPAGIGVYRSADVGFTVNLDCQNSSAMAGGLKTSDSQTKFLLNNIGGVATFRLGSATVPNLNVGFTFHKAASYNSAVSGRIPTLRNSVTNYIAGISNASGLTVGDVETTSNYDPYYPTDGGIASPWASVLGYDSYFITPEGDPDNPRWQGQWGDGTQGNGSFREVIEGSVDEYNIALGGNIANKVYWGMDFGIIDLDYSLSSRWGEQMQGAYVDLGDGNVNRMNSNIRLGNEYWASGSGFNYKLGVIVKPIQELRLAFAFHTPTWYNITENYYAQTEFNYDGENRTTSAETPTGSNEYNFRTPWRFIAGVAGVIEGRLILSADYEWQSFNHMHFSPYDSYGWGGGWDYDNPWDDPWYWERPVPQTRASSDDPFGPSNSEIREYYQTSNTLRLGAEFRVTPRFSVRAGYAFTSSPVREKAKDNQEIIMTTGTMPQYTFDDDTHYVTCGLGYNFKSFYVDAAYVYKQRKATWHAYTPDPTNQTFTSPQADVKYNNSQVVLTMGFKF